MGKKAKRRAKAAKRAAKASSGSSRAIVVGTADGEEWLGEASSKRPARVPYRRRFTAANSYPWRERPIGADQSGDQAVHVAHVSLMAWARHLDQNVGIAGAVLDELVNRTVGAGIIIRPDPRDSRGNPIPGLAEELLERHDEHSEFYDTTGELDRGAYERHEARALFRDGAVFSQHVAGRGRNYPFEPGEIPYRVEFLEQEMCPWDLDDRRRRFRMGVQVDTWRRPIAYAFYKEPPNDFLPGSTAITDRDLKRVRAENVSHLKLAKRWPQTRGVSVFAAGFAGIFDLDDYKQSELIAARLAASFTGFIKRDPAFYNPPDEDELESAKQRELEMDPGQIFDDLLPGEDVGVVESKRPNPALVDFRREIIRDIAAATGTRYSTIARDFGGTFSSQRQELVEAVPMYDALRQYLVRMGTRARYRRWILTAVLDRQLAVPRGASLRSISRARFIGPRLPWIDPAKETAAIRDELELGLATVEEIRDRRGSVADLESASR